MIVVGKHSTKLTVFATITPGFAGPQSAGDDCTGTVCMVYLYKSTERVHCDVVAHEAVRHTLF